MDQAHCQLELGQHIAGLAKTRTILCVGHLQEGPAQDALRSRLDEEVGMCTELLEVRRPRELPC